MLETLYLDNFRNIEEARISFHEGVNWIVGENGQGKTNLLEAIYLLTTGRSFRTSHLKDLIRKEASSFQIGATFIADGVRHSIRLVFDGEKKQLQVNSKTYSHFNPLIGLIPGVIYAPEDVGMIGGPPAQRRKFLNVHIAQENPLYVHHLSRYHKALKQRNELLKKRSINTIEVWEEMMRGSTAFLMEKRKEALKELLLKAKEIMLKLSQERDALNFRLLPSIPTWEEDRSKELILGSTLSGPHRDEIRFLIDGKSAKSFASIGQKHTLLAALRFAEWERLREKTHLTPLFLIDDFGAHLDQERQKALWENIASKGQVFVTAPQIPEGLKAGAFYAMHLGQCFEKSPA